MKKLITVILLSSGIFYSSLLFAQTEQVKKETKKEEIKGKTEKENFQTKKTPLLAKFSLDLSIGTRGVGLACKYMLSERWVAKIGFSYMPLTFSDSLKLSGYNTHIDLVNNFTGVQLIFEYKPFKNIGIKIIGGFSYFAVANFNCNLTPTGTYKFGNQFVSSEQIGTVTTNVDWKGFAPFIGLGFGKAHPKHKIGVSLGVGIYYLPQPVVTVTGTNFLSGNDQNQPWLAENIKDYRYLPVVNFHIIYRFKKPQL